MKISYVQPSTPESTNEGWDDITTYKGYPNLHCKLLEDHGHEVESVWLTREDSRSVLRHEWGHKIRRFPVSWGDQYGEEFSVSMLRHLLWSDVDLIHIRGYPQRNVPPLLPLLSAVKPVVIQQMGAARTYDPERFKTRLRLQLLQFADMVTALNSDEITNLHAAGFPKAQTAHLPNAVNTELFGPIDRSTAASALDMDSNRKYILYVGRLSHQKNVPELVTGMEHVVQQFPDAVLLVVGDGSQTERARIHNRIERGGLARNVRLEGHQPQAQLIHYYNLADVAVFPSNSEGLGMVVLEAAACHTPIIATPAFEHTVLRDGSNSLFIDPEQPATIGEAILELLTDPELASDLADQANADVLTEYHPDAIYEQVKAVYQKALAHHRQ